MNLQQRIKDYIETNTKTTFSFNELAKKLRFHSVFEKRELDKVLKALIAEGYLYENAGKFNKANLSTKETIKGKIQGNKKGFGFLIRDDGKEDLFVSASDMKDAFHGDRVSAVAVKGDRAKVTNVLERGEKRIVGSYKKEKSFGFVTPDSKYYFNDIFIPESQSASAESGSKVICEITSYSRGKNPEGKIVEIIGTGRTGEILSILAAHGFTENFPQPVLAQARELAPKSAQGRKDFRDLLTVTIDGDDAKDLDDAVSLEVISGGKCKLYVHIADVSEYVRSQSPLDKEALKRATSVYFPGKVFPMLPPELSNDLCSLNADEDKLTLTAVIELADGVVTSSEICESVIRSNARLTYRGVAEFLESGKAVSQDPKVGEMLKEMQTLALLLKDKRRMRGAVNFESRECYFQMEEDKIVDILPYPMSIANQIIEEFMLLANETVAENMQKAEIPFVFRVHEKPSQEKEEAFRIFSAGCGFSLPAGTLKPKDYQNLLEQAEGSPYRTIINKVMLRSMQKARYTVENLGHFGLAADYYCHFTSPIRRYPDLMIHRMIKLKLHRRLAGESEGLWKTRCAEAAARSSEREVAAEEAERDADDYYKCEYMQKHIGECFDGLISGVTDFGIFVALSNTVEGRIAPDKLPEDRYLFHPEKYTLMGVKHTFSLGDPVKIRVESVDMQMRKISFAFAENS